MTDLALTPRASWQRNALAGYLLQGASYLLPLITLPFLLRTLGPGAYGELAFAHAAVMFAVLLLDAGLDTCATRALSRPDADRQAASRIYSAVTWLKGLMLLSLLSLLLLLMSVLPGVAAKADLYLATFLLLPGSLLFPTWLFQGLEIMRYTTLCAISGRLLATLLIFALVRTPEDLVVAAALQAGATAASGIFCQFIIARRLGLRLLAPQRALRREMGAIWRASRRLGFAEFVERALGNSSVFLLGLFVAGPALGAYAALEKLVRALQGLQQPLLRSLFPRYCALWATQPERARHLARRATAALSSSAVALAFATALLAPWLLGWLLGATASGQLQVFYLLCGWLACACASGVYGLLWLVAGGDRHGYSNAVLLTGLVQLGALVIGGFGAGATGIATALFGSELLRASLLAGLAEKRPLGSRRTSACTS